MKIPRIAYAAYGFALFVIILDQLTKAWIMGGLDLRELGHIQVLSPLFNLTWVENRGVSFGLFGDGSGRWALSAFSIAVAGVLGWWALKADRRLLITAIGLVMGGALGNVIDRIRFGYVVDFLDFSGPHFFLGSMKINFPWIFNVADSAICIGVVLLILDSVKAEQEAKVGLAAEKS
ncbi:MAG: signal peptidase II [Alphaproteobacteria bacterium]|uniref:signal peptidase II n=1 Tax=Brevundimonas sp. TaxID=1871086 RepID=UPI0017BE1BF2|nr:signal peptidase II [Brevundimonas sp.]MBU3972000.1 signal peptidase II [Alphaproteobacteria bacterium]MBA3048158.1 signal peptidase II [Brevundimonas sp.]MBU3973570.1 signal peptidase II [Alphaproteobacteria bacterium]MBU4039506.1 signal peptidase II [Alphaproteobacteria bacterium]MBU4136161.1 signal peptidase II [Alphaproteobacteria bacterium]